jgi:hypothetical protein
VRLFLTSAPVRRAAVIGSQVVLIAGLVGSPPMVAAAGSNHGVIRTISVRSSATWSPKASAADASGPIAREFPAAEDDGDTAGTGGVNRSHSTGSRVGNVAQSAKVAASNPELLGGFDGLNHRNQRLANGGNQFSVEPPDQALCVGNGFVLEAVNDVARVYDFGGQPAGDVQDLNSFFGYPAAFDRTPGAEHPFGQFVTDPSCIYDAATNRWFLVVLTLETDPDSGDFTGANHLDIAVSNSGSPTGSWSIYQIDAADDGSNGTPDHRCTSDEDDSGFGPCIGDYPHIGADTNGFYITTNEYAFFGPEFHGAQVYAMSKTALAAGGVASLVQFDTNGQVAGDSGFTLWPATAPGAQETGAGGTEYFLSSNAADEAHGNGVPVGPRASEQILTWAVTNTSSLTTATPSLTLSYATVDVARYAVPPKANQKGGSTPLATCLNSNPCSLFVLGIKDPFVETEGVLDSNDTRMQQVTFAAGKLWGALDTAVKVNGADTAGVEWFIVNPGLTGSTIAPTLASQGYLGLGNNHLTYPAVGVTANGKGVIAFTVTGNSYFPSAGYALLDATNGASTVHVAAAGAGPQDGFSEYKVLAPVPGNARPRWGDYGAAAVDGNDIWLASEYIAQTCSFNDYNGSKTSPAFGSCGGLRTTLANWATRVSRIQP